jgi:hypothetical protein
MILYTNGDSHAAGAEAVNSYAFAEDDPRYWNLERRPHPDNLRVSWGPQLAELLKMAFHTEAESASSNHRILRTTREWLDRSNADPSQVFLIIQWSTWEREEWLIDGTYYQVNASGIDEVPEGYQEQYKNWIANLDWDDKTREWHKVIRDFSEELTAQGYKHIFFNGNNSFVDIPVAERYNYGTEYMGPYLTEETYDGWLRNQGYDTVITSNYHFGPAAHSAWTKHLLRYIVEHKLL